MIDTILPVKAKSLAVYFGISVPFLALIGIDVDLLMIWIILMCIDTFMWWIIAMYYSEFKSRTATERFSRKWVLVLIVCAIGFTWTAYPQMDFLAHVMMMTFGLAELISILRHGYTIYAKERLPETDVLKIVLKALVSKLETTVINKK